MLAGTDERWNKTILAMAIATGWMFFDKLSGVRIGVATLTLVGLPQIAGLLRAWKALGIREAGFMARFAGAVGVRWFQRESERGVQGRVDPSLAEQPIIIRCKVARLAIPLWRRFKAMRACVAVDTGLSFHRAEYCIALLMAVRASGGGVGSLQ